MSFESNKKETPLIIVAAIQAYLKEKNGQGTVPHVYINQEFIGGCSQLQGIQGKKLDDKIAGKA